ncbi:hydroxyacid dehydrogenase [Cryobacterium sp. PH29-G1]|uniref:hydroxyacid dehydrogenase n=1 Tax=Cryobacterium sp. PH29-G1 TaxID=3046211 RepID=UPI0024BA3AE9|nr:hydroxyacid dehydrogenase [Cryobacterium sp. PH29-G1]MDJ0348858.1 hydroxyacid dehydrogenase [Cryobacterium sp. PH29-G1]
MSSRYRPVVVVTEPVHHSGMELLSQSCEVLLLSELSGQERTAALHRADSVIVRSTPFTEDMMDASPRLSVIGRHGAGIDNIDVEAARARGIAIVNTPRSNTDSVAEYVVTVALMLLKRIPEVSAALRSGAFPSGGGSLPGQVDRGGLNGRDASGMTLGLIGAGAIGSAVARRAMALGLVVKAFDPYIPQHDDFEIVPDLGELLECSDIVSLHVPGGGTNRHLIGAAEIARMRDGSMLINAARGDLVDDAALVAALESGHLAGAALDVFESEPPAPDAAIFSAPNLIVTPHMAAMTKESLQRMSMDVATGVLKALASALDTDAA